MKVEFNRSKPFVARKRLETGTNWPENVTVTIDPAQLTVESRRVILESNRGTYPNYMDGLDYDSSFGMTARYATCRAFFASDAEVPTAADLDAAIHAALEEIARRRAEYERLRAEREAREAADLAAKEAVVTARQLLADEIAELKKERDEARTDRMILAEFLAAVPDDALRGTLKAEAASPEALAQLRQKVEDASPVRIFVEEDADE